MGKFQYLFFRSFLLVLIKFHFGKKSAHEPIILRIFEIFLIFPNFLKLQVLNRSATSEATHIYHVYYASFHLWWKENLVKYKCLKVLSSSLSVNFYFAFYLQLIQLFTAPVVKISHVLSWIYFISLKALS